MMKNNIPLDNNYPENWDKMKIGLNSQFCGNCQKNASNFTSKSREEIIAYQLTYANEQVCRSVQRTQVDISSTDLLMKIKALAKRPKNANLSFYLLLISILMLAGCISSSSFPLLPSQSKIEKLATVLSNPIEQTTVKQVKEEPMKHTLAITDTVAKEMVTEKNGTASKIEKDVAKFKGNDISIYYSDPNPYPYPLILLGEIFVDEFHADFNNSFEPYWYVEKMPEFTGGVSNLMGYVKNQLEYPEWEAEQGIEGYVVANFVVNKEGKVEDIKILKSVTGSENFDAEVIKVIQQLPDWIPGEKDGELVAVQFTLPILFEL